MADAATQAAGIGHNAPPESTPFEAVKVHVEDLMIEARNWADGQPIERQEEADAVARLIDDFRAAYKAADEARKEEARPFDEGKAEVQARYGALIADTKGQKGTIVRALEALKATLTPWLQAKERERLAAETEARTEAARKAQEAAQATQSINPADIGSVEQAEALVADAKDAAREADQLARDRSHAKGDGRAIGLRRVFVAVMNDRRAALNHYAATRPDDLVAFIQKLADEDVRAGKRQIPGFDVIVQSRV